MSTAENPVLSAITLRQMREDGVQEVFDLIKAEGWNLTLSKLRSLTRLKPEAFFVLVDKEGAVIATFSLMPTFPGEVLLGNLVVRKSHRGKGIGRKILTYYVHQAVKFRTLVLNAVPQALGFYQNIKMCPVDQGQNHVIVHTEVDPEAIEKKMNVLKADLINVQICPFDKSRLQELLAYDKDVHGGYDTSVNLMAVVENCDVVVAVETTTNILLGYAAPFISRGQIAFDGVFAENEAIALALYRESLHAHPSVLKVKLQMFESRQFLAQFGTSKDAYTYVKFSIGYPSSVPVENCFYVSDCDYCV